MEQNINKENLLKRCFALSTELAKQINTKNMFITGLKEVETKLTTVRGQSNEIISLLKQLGFDDEQLKAEMEKLAKENKPKEEIKEDAKVEKKK